MPRAADDGQHRKLPSQRSPRRKGPAIPTLKVNNPFCLRMYLPDDLLTEILVRLPAKSATRFKSACKKWLSIISSDLFCHQHTLRCPKLQPSLMLEMDSGEYFYFNPITLTTTNDHQKEKMIIPYNNNGRPSDLVPGYRIEHACNGLMLLRYKFVHDPTNEGSIEHHRRRDRCYCIYNPTTRQSRKVFLTHNDKYPYVKVILGFDPSKSPYYKIVCIRSTDHYDYHQIEVYDSESHIWKLSLDAFMSPNTILSCDGTYWNNGIYWETYDGDSYCWFDIGENKIKTLPSPRISNTIPRLQASNGNLYSYLVASERVTVWELGVDDDHRPHWLLRYDNFLRKCTGDRILRLMGRSDEDESTCKLLIHEAGEIWTYNFLDETYEYSLDIKIQPCYQPKDGDEDDVIAFHFAETLALV